MEGKDHRRGKQAAELYRIAISNRLAEIAREVPQERRKGLYRRLIATRKWKDQSGADREVTEIRAEALQLL
ncbi:single-stranded DNA-binding protein [Acinetobacter haemolyticus]|nr:single-stranded DNA-binding protein [Acinetobacter haemolyticus]NAR90769.1 single-stranded DNA-binding protein [Acinetobacter haemolyticus]QDJ91004.1 single-stranded DNA-binding protein [Acinetobacter haemolyticus]